MMKAEDCYDIIFVVDSIKNISDGWEFRYNDAGYQNFLKRKDKSACTVCVVGNANKGKSFILQKLAGFDFPSGFSVKTEGLSLKYPKTDMLNFILFDTAGLETPLIQEKFYDLDKDLKGKMDEKNEETDEEQKIKEMKEGLIEGYARDKQITEFFLQSFVIHHANILVLVMNQMTYTDQILLNKVKRQCKKGRKLFVIHNLSTFVTIQQCENYIENTLMKSLTFKVKQIPMINMEASENSNQNKNKFYYREEIIGEEENLDYQLTVVHLLMANDGEKSEAGKYYNESCINFLKSQIITQSAISVFNIKDQIKNYFMERSPEFLENEKDSFQLVEVQKEKGDEQFPNLVLREKDDETKKVDVQLKKWSIDELGNEMFQSSKFVPPHRIYKTDDKAFLVFELELPGDKTLTTECKAIGSDYVFRMGGTKKVGFDKKLHEKLNWKRDNGTFQLVYRIPKADCQLLKKNPSRVESDNGIVAVYYPLDKEVDSD